jgi:hypothetical protein
MAKNETVRIRPVILQGDKDALAAISDYKAPVYKPANDNFTLDKLQAAEDAMKDAQVTEVQKQNEADNARDAATAAEWAFHNIILEGKNQVKAQYGEDSNQYAGLGLTKKSERSSPGTRTKKVQA